MSWEYELGIWRRGGLVWVGPTLEPEWSDDGLVLPARDLLQWFERRVLDQNHSYIGTDLATIFEAYADDAMSRDPVPALTVTTTPTGILGDRKVAGIDHRYAADEMRELMRDGLDVTVIARDIITGGIEVPTAHLQRVNNFWLHKAKLKEAGLLRSTEVFVQGSPPQGQSHTVFGVFGGTHSVDPPVLIQRVFNESQITDVSSCTDAAETRWDEINQSPLYLTGEVDARRGPDINDLVPGALAAADVTCGARRVLDNLRLSSIDVTVSSSDAIVSETIRAEFIPVGTAGITS